MRARLEGISLKYGMAKANLNHPDELCFSTLHTCYAPLVGPSLSLDLSVSVSRRSPALSCDDGSNGYGGGKRQRDAPPRERDQDH